MTRVARVGIVMAGMWLAAGCRASTQVVEEPRVDLELVGGNRGYLVGSPPDTGIGRTTRQVIETAVEIPGFFNRTRGPSPASAPVQLGDVAPPEMDFSEATPPPEDLSYPATAEVSYDSYVVQRGDTLWSIAAKPEVFGNAGAWRQLFEANRDLLRSPDQLRAGMTLRVPRDGSSSPGQTAGPPWSGDEPTFTK